MWAWAPGATKLQMPAHAGMPVGEGNIWFLMNVVYRDASSKINDQGVRITIAGQNLEHNVGFLSMDATSPDGTNGQTDPQVVMNSGCGRHFFREPATRVASNFFIVGVVHQEHSQGGKNRLDIINDGTQQRILHETSAGKTGLEMITPTEFKDNALLRYKCFGQTKCKGLVLIYPHPGHPTDIVNQAIDAENPDDECQLLDKPEVQDHYLTRCKQGAQGIQACVDDFLREIPENETQKNWWYDFKVSTSSRHQYKYHNLMVQEKRFAPFAAEMCNRAPPSREITLFQNIDRPSSYYWWSGADLCPDLCLQLYHNYTNMNVLERSRFSPPYEHAVRCTEDELLTHWRSSTCPDICDMFGYPTIDRSGQGETNCIKCTVDGSRFIRDNGVNEVHVFRTALPP